MMAEYRDRLVRIYARNKVETIENVPAFRALCAEFRDNHYFDNDRNKIEYAKVTVEQHLDRPGLTQKDSVRNAIQLLVANRRTPKRDLFHELISAGYKDQWTAAQRTYFDHAWKTIQLKYDFFLSFTSRYPDPGLARINPINVAYKHFINHVLGEDSIAKSDQRDTNLLARALHARLLVSPNRGYYYPRQQNDNAETERKLAEACDSSLMFIQLIQSILFDLPDEGTNYCFFEWERVMGQFSAEDKEKRMLYVLAEMDYRGLQQLNPPDDYSQWHEHVVQKDRPHLPTAAFWKQTVLQDLDERISNHLLSKIRNAWIELGVGVPN
jgi:hypothetical protein